VNEWSPDGTKLLYQGREGGTKDLGSLFLFDLATESSTRLTDLPLEEAAWYEIHTDFSPDGREVLFHLPRTADATDPKFDIWSVPVSGGEPTMVVRDAAFPMVVSGGKEIAFVVPEPGGFYGPQIAIVSADGSRRQLLVADNAIYLPRESPDGTRIAYGDGGSIYLVDVATGDTSGVAVGAQAEWVDDDTLIVRP
jgi:Tol biopolymer transport system component